MSDYVYLYTHVATKILTITEDAYERLVALERGDESFSDVIRRLGATRREPLDSAGAYPGLGEAVTSAREEFEVDLSSRANELSR